MLIDRLSLKLRQCRVAAAFERFLNLSTRHTHALENNSKFNQRSFVFLHKFSSNIYLIQLPVFPQEIDDQIPWFSTSINLNSMTTVTHTEATIELGDQLHWRLFKSHNNIIRINTKIAIFFHYLNSLAW